jgi:hypothetical protein
VRPKVQFAHIQQCRGGRPRMISNASIGVVLIQPDILKQGMRWIWANYIQNLILMDKIPVLILMEIHSCLFEFYVFDMKFSILFFENQNI